MHRKRFYRVSPILSSLSNSGRGSSYLTRVIRIKPYRGRLTLTSAGKLIFERPLHTFDAPFGHDLEDVQMWQAVTESAADDDYRKRGETPPNSNQPEIRALYSWLTGGKAIDR
jgi:hypothetical protein